MIRFEDPGEAQVTRFELTEGERSELVGIEREYIPASSVKIEMATRSVCRLILREETWLFKEVNKKLILLSTPSPEHPQHVFTYAELRALQMIRAAQQGHLEDSKAGWPKWPNAHVEKLNVKDRVDLAHFESIAVPAGDVWIEAMTRAWCRYYVGGRRWRYGPNKNGGFVLTDSTSLWRRETHRYVKMLAREAVRAIRQGHRERNTNSALSKQAKRRLEELKQLRFKFEFTSKGGNL